MTVVTNLIYIAKYYHTNTGGTIRINLGHEGKLNKSNQVKDPIKRFISYDHRMSVEWKL